MKYAAIVLGFVIWVLISLLSGRSEAWDSDLYFIAGLPVMTLFAGIIGYMAPQMGWRTGLWMALGQFMGLLALSITSGSGFGLLPLGIIGMIVLSMPMMLAGMIVGKMFGKK